METFLRTVAVNICGAIYAPFLWAYRLMRIGVHKYKVRRDEKRKRLEKERIMRSIKWANELAKETGYRYYVLKINGHIVVKPKRIIKDMLKCSGKYFERGTTIQDIENIALHKTN